MDSERMGRGPRFGRGIFPRKTEQRERPDFEPVETMPVLALRGISVFPEMLLNFDVERSFSVAALTVAMEGNQLIFLVTQKDVSENEPTEEDLYRIGCIAYVRQLMRIPGSRAVRVLIEGVSRAKLLQVLETEPHIIGEVEPIEERALDDKDSGSVRLEALIRHCYELFDDYAQLTGSVPTELQLNVIDSDDPGYIADLIAQNIYLRHSKKQQLLEELRPLKRLSLLCDMLTRELEVLEMEQDITERTHEHMSRTQREYFLREQMKAIREELGEDEDSGSEPNEYTVKIKELKLKKETEEKLLSEVVRLGKQSPHSPETSVLRNYLDTVLALPWNKTTKEVLDIEKARRVLEADHFGMEKVKERILEFLAVKQLAPEIKGGVICLVGPPGVGKTSVAASIARATNRRIARLSLGGVHDEAEIRGHRRTYVGAMPGRIIAALGQAKSSNALLLLDEIDKLGSDYRGDPSAALLEALDAEQNHSFRDHYLEVPFDLSDVLFITTANTRDTIPRALLDRMEVIEIGSYTDEEKLQIAKRHLLPKQRKRHGINGTQLRVTDDAIREMITLYTRESGVRTLERQLAAVCRRTAKEIATDSVKAVRIKSGQMEHYLGAPRYKPESKYIADEVGLVRGLAWTQVGGDTLDVEVGVVDGTGKLELTGNLGNVMKESARAALSYIRSRAKILGLSPDFYKTKDIHVHFPEGAVPKDGPSAGITICVALISALTGIPVRRDLAMTGEISLRGRILPIGGLKEKTMAALRAGVNTVIIPADNEPDLAEIDQTVRAALNFVTADHVDKILDVALARAITLTGVEHQPGKSVKLDTPMPPPEGREIVPAVIVQ